MPSSPPPMLGSRYYARTFGIVTTAVLAYLLFRVLMPFFAPMLWAGLLAFLFQPLNVKVLKKWRRPALSAALITALVAVIILGPVSLVGVVFVRQASDLLVRFQAEALQRKLPALEVVLELGPVKALLAWLGNLTALSREEIVANATDAAQAALQRLASLGGSVVLGAFTVVTQFGLTMFLLFFFVRDGQQTLSRAVRLVPLSEERKEELRVKLGGVTRGVVLGTLLTGLVQGTLIGVGFTVSGLPSPVVFGALGALASLVPMVGTALVWVPAVISLFAQGHTGWAIFLGLWCGVLVTGSDNVIRPLVVSSSSNVSTLLVFVGVLGGVTGFGVAGLFVGPVLLTLVAALLQYADESGLRARAPPPEALEAPPVASPKP